MNAETARRYLLATLIAASCAIATIALAQSGGGYDLHWNVLAAGGGVMSGASGYTLTGTVAQSAAKANTASACQRYTVRSGFWTGIEPSDEIFCNGFE